MIHSPHTFTFPDYNSLSRVAALQIKEKIAAKLSAGETFVLGMATGSSPLKLYNYLLEYLKEYKGSLAQFYTVNLDEYYPLSKTSPCSYFQYMVKYFWKPLSEINSTFNWEKNGYIIYGDTSDPEKESEEYEKRIHALGGVDLQLLGIGVNGHIGFNEPGSEANSRTRIVDLAQSTIQLNKKHFSKNEEVPAKAITMGIATILEAKEIYLIVSGENKKEIMKKLKKISSPTSELPASFLLTHPHVSVFTDINDQYL